MNAEIVSEIKTEIMREADPEFAERLTQYFKEPIKTHGLRAPQQKEIARKYYHRVKKGPPHRHRGHQGAYGNPSPR